MRVRPVLGLAVGCLLAALLPLAVPAVADSADAPGAPGSVIATVTGSSVAVRWGEAAAGTSPITGYTVTADPGGVVCRTAEYTSCTAYGLAPGVAHTLRVTATSALATGPAAASAPVTPIGVPAAPDPVHVEEHGRWARVVWTAVDVPGATTTYSVQSVPPTPCVTVTTTSCDLRGLEPGSVSLVRVVARNSAGVGDPSRQVEITGSDAPARPSPPRLVPGVGRLTASWTAPDDGGSPITGYVVHVVGPATDGVVAVPATARSAVLARLAPARSFAVTVQAVNATGVSAKSFATSAFALDGRRRPDRPGAPAVVARSSASVSIRWRPASADRGTAVDRYEIRVRHGRVVVRTLVVKGSTLSAVLPRLRASTTYSVDVRAHNAAGWGGRSKASAVRTR